MRKILLLITTALLASCRNNNPLPERFDWEIEDSIKKAKEDSINRILKIVRDKANIAMSEDKTVLGAIYLGQSKKDYEKEMEKIRSELGYKSLEIGNVYLDVEEVKFHKGKLYSLTLMHDYIYREYKREYNSTPEYHPYPHIQGLITHFKQKYGQPDEEYKGTSTIRGREEADYVHMYWIFPKKRITINNEAEKYGGGAAGASYILTITIDDYNITDMLEKKAKMREEIERNRQKKKDSILDKKRQDLSNSI